MSEPLTVDSILAWDQEVQHRREIQCSFVDRVPLDFLAALLEKEAKRARRRAFWRKVFYRRPDFIIGDPADPYLLRWHLLPRNGLVGIYLHCILKSDFGRELHDHAYANVSVVLRGSYREIVPANPRIGATFGLQEMHTRKAGDIVARVGSQLHRLEIDHGKPCWTLFVMGPRYRKWGFQTPDGWVPHYEYLNTEPEEGRPMIRNAALTLSVISILCIFGLFAVGLAS